MKKKILALMLAALMPVSFGGCGSPDRESGQKDTVVSGEDGTKSNPDTPAISEVMPAARKNVADISSLDVQMLMEMDMDMTDGMQKQSAQTKITTDMTCFYNPMRAKIDMNIESGALGGLAVRMYMETDKKAAAQCMWTAAMVTGSQRKQTRICSDSTTCQSILPRF